MSCFIVSSKTLSIIANYIATLLNTGFNYCGYEAPQELRESFNDARGTYGDYKPAAIYQKLYELNLQAYRERYNRDPEIDENRETGFVSGASIDRPREYTTCAGHVGAIPVIERWHYEILNKLECYLYQCCEGTIDETKIYKALQTTAAALTRFIVHAAPDYVRAPWG